MDIIINATTPENVFTQNGINMYTKIIYSIYEQAANMFDLSALVKIIVPEDYVAEITAFQKSRGEIVRITDNEYGRAFGQTFEIKQDDKSEFIFFVSKELIMALIPDNIDITSSLDDVNKQIFEDTKSLAINTLCHEMAHVHEMSVSNSIAWIVNISDNYNDLHNMVLDKSLAIWREYFACRTTCNTYKMTSEYMKEFYETAINLENDIINMRKQYNIQNVGLNDFVVFFHLNTSFLLKKAAYAYGNYYVFCEPERSELIKINHRLLGDTRIGKIWSQMDEVLATLYTTFPEWPNNSIFDELNTLIMFYYNSFEVFIEERPEGLYYSVPVRL